MLNYTGIPINFDKKPNLENEVIHSVEADDAWINILDPMYHKAKLLCTGPSYQAEIPPLNLYTRSIFAIFVFEFL